MAKSSVKQVILHAGLHKTSTSSIQKTLYSEKNKSFLHDKGYFYIEDWHFNNSVPIYSLFSENPDAYHMHQRYNRYIADIKILNKKYLNEFHNQVRCTSFPSLIISGEDISLLNKDCLKKLDNFFKDQFSEDVAVKIIIFVRNPITWIASSVQENVKIGLTVDEQLDDMKKKISRLYRNRISKFIKVFGRDNVRVVSFEDSIQSFQGPVGFFLSILGFSKQEIGNFFIERANVGMSDFAVNFLDYINKKEPLLVNGKLNPVRRRGDITSLHKMKGAKFDLSVKLKRELYELAVSDMQWLKKKFNINYLDNNFKNNIINNKLNDHLAEEIEKIIPTFSLALLLLLKDFISLSYKVPEIKNKKLLTIIEKYINIRKVEDRIFRNLNIDQTKRVFLYRELALLLESFDQIEAARIFMGEALRFNPAGSFIRKKYNEYEICLKSERNNF